MPEGDTVWRTARRLDRALSGAQLRETDFRVPSLATLDLSGREVVETLSRGKHLLTRVAPDRTLHTHLKMEGSWHLYRPGSPWRRPGHEARVVLRTDEWTAVGFSLGVVEVLPTADEASAVGHLGPDLLGDWDEEEAVRRLGARGDRAVGEALLDQRNLAGAGTLYRSETLFLVGVHPETPVGAVQSLTRLVRMTRKLMMANRERSAQTTTGDTRPGQRLWVFERAGRPCRRCGTTVRSAHLGPPGHERVSYWCPACQPVPDDTLARRVSGGGGDDVPGA